MFSKDDFITLKLVKTSSSTSFLLTLAILLKIVTDSSIRPLEINQRQDSSMKLETKQNIYLERPKFLDLLGRSCSL
jgi:uncharacterized membrane protein